MDQKFEFNGVALEYPKAWDKEFDQEGDSWTVSLQGEGTAFLVVTFVPDVDDPTDLVDAAIEGLRDEYPTLEADDAVDTIAGQPAVGADVSFEHLDLTNTCWVRAVPSGNGAVLVLAQCTDHELSTQGETLKKIMGTLTVEE